MLKWFLRKFNISWVDDDPSALASLMESTRYRMKQIGVQLDDGTWLRCDDLPRFADAPFGPCKIGNVGDLAMYLTHEESKEGVERELQTVQDAEHGDRITYIPASKIRTINLRYVE